MARIRTIKPEFWSSPSMRNLDPWARLLFVAMWNWADDTGRGVANVRELAAFAFPDEDDALAPTAAELPTLLAEIRGRFGVVFYEVGGRRYYEVPTWDKHQRNERRAKSKYPSPDDGNEFDPGPGDQRKPEQPRGVTELPPHSVGTSDAPNGSSAPGTGEQGNRGTGEQGENTFADLAVDGATLLEFPDPQPEPKRPTYPADFEAAWSAYGRKGAKRTAYAEWQRATKRAPADTITAAIAPYVAATPEARFRKDFERWLKGDGWESALPHAVGTHQPYRNPRDVSAYYDEDL